jgi:hypothetical protein
VLFVGGGHFLLVLPNTSGYARPWRRRAAPRTGDAAPWTSVSFCSSHRCPWRGRPRGGKDERRLRDLAASLAREKARPSGKCSRRCSASPIQPRQELYRLRGPDGSPFRPEGPTGRACGHCAALHALGRRLSDAVFLWQKPRRRPPRRRPLPTPPQQETEALPSPGLGSGAESLENAWRRVRYDTAKVFGYSAACGAGIRAAAPFGGTGKAGRRFVPLPWAGYT